MSGFLESASRRISQEPAYACLRRLIDSPEGLEFGLSLFRVVSCTSSR